MSKTIIDLKAQFGKGRLHAFLNAADTLTLEALGRRSIALEHPEVRELRDLCNKVLHEEENPVGESYNIAALRLAIAQDVPVTFNYAKGDGAVIETRRFQPHSVQEVGNHQTAIGYDPDRDDVRAFRVDRIKGAVRL